MKNTKEKIRIGICKHTGRKIVQVKDISSDDAIDETGWLCLHEDTVEEEFENVLKFNYNIQANVTLN